MEVIQMKSGYTRYSFALKVIKRVLSNTLLPILTLFHQLFKHKNKISSNKFLLASLILQDLNEKKVDLIEKYHS
ncbi:hypothetical protein RTB9991CWPP_00490 [Rickettsia typhi str. B9991CWPP]|nr:hypothetical protein RTB9991CWPP_00490 [Rickettsia typhi str. B9991CWPP]